MTKPRHEWDNVRLYRGDAIKILRALPTRSISCVISDPPYNLGFNYRSYHDRRDDYADWCAEWLAECERVSEGSVCFSCGHPNIGMWYKIKEPRSMLCWHKPAATARGPLGFSNWEPVLLYGPPLRARNFNDIFRAGIIEKDHLDWHPCPKPLQWGLKLVKMLSRPGDTVLDPFLGSGTVGYAAVQLGRKFVGNDLDPVYVDKAAERIRSAVRVVGLWDE